MRASLMLLLALLSVPVLAQTPTPAPDKTPPDAAAASKDPALLKQEAAILDGLVNKPQIVGITKKDGTRYLGRLIAGDHGQYMAQEFHFAGPTKKTTEKTAPVRGLPKAHTRLKTVGRGRFRQRVWVTNYTPGPVKKGRTIHVKTATMLPDDRAVRLLLAGVAGSIRNPEEISGDRDLFKPAEITFIQALSPPKKKSSKKSAKRTAAKSGTAWTLTTLWPEPAETKAAKSP